MTRQFMAGPILAMASILTMSLGGCAMLGLGPSIELSQSTAAAYDNYLNQLGPDNHGYFAVSEDGSGYGFTLCGAEACEPDALKTALDGCKIGSEGKECQVFAVDRDPQMNHSVAEQ
jgi:hypothetical protein